MESLFRFTMIRPPEKVIDSDIINAGLDSDFQRSLRDIYEDNNLVEKNKLIKEKGLEYADSEKYVKEISNLQLGDKYNLVELLNDITKGTHFSLKEFAKKIEDIFTTKLTEIISSEDFLEDKIRIADSIIAMKIVRSIQSNWIKTLTRLYRLYSLIEFIAKVPEASELWKDKRAISKHISKMIRLPIWAFPYEKPMSGRTFKETEFYKKLINKQHDLEDLKNTRTSVMSVIRELTRIRSCELQAPLKSNHYSIRDKVNNLVIKENSKLKFFALKKDKTKSYANSALVQSSSLGILSKEAINSLSKTAHQILRKLELDPRKVTIINLISSLNNYHKKIVADFDSTKENIKFLTNEDIKQISTIGTVKLQSKIGDTIPKFIIPGYTYLPKDLEELISFKLLPGVPTTHGTIQPVGVMDLLVVKQNLKKYEPGEIAHIENVLKGESKVREHRRTYSKEQYFLEETTQTREEERDSQSTERFELQREVEKTISTDASLKFGASLSAKYGPSIEFKTYADGAISSSVEASQKQASTYSKEITDRSAFKVSEKVHTEQSLKISEEFEEKNNHTLNNISDNHVIGIYQWIDKIYEAQVYNYGRRTLYDLMIPEPASFFIAAMKTNLGDIIGLEEPIPFDTPANEIDEDNYNELGSRYGLSGLTPPPEYEITISEIITGRSEHPDDYSTFPTISREIPVTANYQAYYASVSYSCHYIGPVYIIVIRIAGDPLYFTNAIPDDEQISVVPLDDITSEVPVTVDSVINSLSDVTVTVTLYARRTDRSFIEWQNSIHAEILQAYEQKLADYENDLSSLESEEEVEIQGRSPSENRTIEKDELKKACISLLTQQHYDHFGAIELDALSYPQINLNEAKEEGPYIRFFEQAFEWEQMMYLFYPYFWSRKNQWIEKLHIQDTDPIHTEFLKSGAARVLLPVREGFEAAVAHFMETGETWSGDDVPDDVTSPLYLDIIKEIKERQEAPLDEIEQGDPWEVRLPTSLIKLRVDSELPKWKKDKETLEWIPDED
ncbi:MAG: hypothetical protein FK734_15570 [Asgard group archaeon]|nr:hypothetical protein [Asgard group archaeon]